jgi:hypothetical protein
MIIEHAPHRMGREAPYRRFVRIWIDTTVAALILLNWLATQLIAAAFFYPRFFMGRLVWHLYQPFAWWWWQYHWPHASVRIGHTSVPLAAAWSLCNHLVFYPLIVLAVIGGIISGWLLKRRGPADVHGSASFGQAEELRKAELI